MIRNKATALEGVFCQCIFTINRTVNTYKSKPSKPNINVENSAISTLTNSILGSQSTINTVQNYGALDSVRAKDKVLTRDKQYPFKIWLFKVRKTSSTNNQKFRNLVKSLSLVNV